MTFGAVFSRVMRPPFGPNTGGVAAIPWYLSGGIAAANCIAAYQPKGAASLAASYVNLVTPGTYNAAPGTAPTWDVTNGWILNGATQYLKSGVIPANNQSWGMIVRFSNGTVTGGGIRTVCGSNAAGDTRFRLDNYNSFLSKCVYANGNFSSSTSRSSGVMGVFGNQGYYNGSTDGSTMTGWGGSAIEIYLGGNNVSGAPGNYFSGYIQAIAIYNTTLSGTIIGLLTTAMAAL